MIPKIVTYYKKVAVLILRYFTKRDKYYPNVGRAGNRHNIGEALKIKYFPIFYPHWKVAHTMIVFKLIREKAKLRLDANGYKNDWDYKETSWFFGELEFQPLKL